jgi:hypothetical protein
MPRLNKRDFSGDECDYRRRMAALRDGVDAAPVTLYARVPVAPVIEGRAGRPLRLRLMHSLGELPRNDREALSQINAQQAESGGDDLTADQVYIHYLEAGNSNFIPDRFMFLGDSTLRNVASHAEAGFSFMNSHRTGGLSSPAEQPYGQTFAGRYEEFEAGDKVYRRALVGVYMLRGVKPNGENGPSTDDLHKGIEGGTLKDVSLGLNFGDRVCDVCSNDVNARDPEGNYLCSHVPGTHRKMSEDERRSQEARGVKRGLASYTLVDAMPSEVSSVYKGAVPGAGFRKARQLAMAGTFSLDEGRELLSAYGPFWLNSERAKFSQGGPMPRVNLLDYFKFWKAAGEPSQFALPDLGSLNLEGIDGDDDGQPQRFEVNPVGRVVRARAAGRLVPASVTLSSTDDDHEDPRAAELAARERKADLRDFAADAREFLAPHRQQGKFNREVGSAFLTLYTLAALDDKHSPAVHPETGRPIKRVDLVKLAIESRPKSKLINGDGGDQLGDESVELKPGEKPLANEPEAVPLPGDPTPQQRRFELLALSPSGVEALKTKYGEEGRAFLRNIGKL